MEVGRRVPTKGRTRRRAVVVVVVVRRAVLKAAVLQMAAVRREVQEAVSLATQKASQRQHQQMAKALPLAAQVNSNSSHVSKAAAPNLQAYLLAHRIVNVDHSQMDRRLYHHKHVSQTQIVHRDTCQLQPPFSRRAVRRDVCV